MESNEDLSFQELLLSSKKLAMQKRQKKHPCAICGKPDLKWSHYSSFNFYRSAYGNPTCFSGITDFIVCSEPCRKEFVRTKLSSGFLMEDVANIPKRSRGASIEWWNNPQDKEEFDVYNASTTWLKGNMDKGWFLVGTVGSGKTCIAVALVRELRRLEKRVLWFDYSSLLAEFSLFRKMRQNELQEEWRKFINTDVIVIDELRSIAYNDEVANEFFYRLITELYRDAKTLIVTTNLATEEIEKAIHPRLVSRLREMCQVYKFTHEDYRKINQ